MKISIFYNMSNIYFINIIYVYIFIIQNNLKLICSFKLNTKLYSEVDNMLNNVNINYNKIHNVLSLLNFNKNNNEYYKENSNINDKSNFNDNLILNDYKIKKDNLNRSCTFYLIKF